MKANELRMGNLIQDIHTRGIFSQQYQEVYIVNGIGKDSIVVEPEPLPLRSLIDQTDKNKSLSIFDVEFIPLTEEWLVRFGFELLENEGDIKYFQLGKYGVKMEEEQDFYFYKGEDVISTLAEIYFVHQLQNLYFALTGEELPVSANSPASRH